jgi:protein SCO1/2
LDRRSLNSFFLHIFCIAFLLTNIHCRYFTEEIPDKSGLVELNFIQPDGSRLDKEFWAKGKSILYFGFSHCPDMCPFALTNLGRAHLILGPLSKEFRFVFVTLDPERDAPNVLANYVKQFPGEKLHALSPSNESMKSIESLFNIVRKKVDNGSSYSIDHSNFIYVLDENLKQIAVYPGGISATELAKRLREMSDRN